MEHIKVVFIDLPVTVFGYTVACYDEGELYYTIIINARLNSLRQRDAYEHEMGHIANHDFDIITDANELEFVRHKRSELYV